MEEIKNEIKEEIDKLINEQKLTKEYRKKKLIIWIARTILSIALYYYFWKYEWVRWTLVLYIPLALFNLIALLGFNYFAKKKAEKIKTKIDSIR